MGYCLSPIAYCLLLLIAGCTAPLTITYDARLGAPAISLKEPLKVSIIPYKDERKTVNRKKLGDIASPVMGIDSAELILEKEPADILTSAFKEQLTLAGFKVNVAESITQAQEADLLLEGSVKVFKLDIAAKDAIEIEIETKATDVKTGNILWSGSIVERNERFAGVMGNTRETINKYVSSSIAKVVKETLTNVASAVEKARPHSVEPVKEEMILGNEGRLALSTAPPQAQVYIDDVYYGLTPIAIDLAPGIYRVNFKLAGFKSAAQKIAVRKGRVTEFAVILEKE
ncbi:MAG: PEGA domain-containing protein [Deltaproteobacteria bacterium]|nr:PEGA domain-containing protein [Deltaproteobacteria bacterium]